MNSIPAVSRSVSSSLAPQPGGGRRAVPSAAPVPTVAAVPTAAAAPQYGVVPQYGVAAYLAAGRLVADRAGDGEVRLELSARVLADGGRVSVARRLESGRTTGIDAVVG